MGLTIKKLKFPYDLGFQYKINPEGSGELLFTLVMKYPMVKRLFPSLNMQDRLAEISVFYPYGCLSEGNKEGLGTRLLEEILKDSTENKCKAVYARTSREKFQALLIKKGFITDTLIGIDYIKLLGDG